MIINAIDEFYFPWTIHHIVTFTSLALVKIQGKCTEPTQNLTLISLQAYKGILCQPFTFDRLLSLPLFQIYVSICDEIWENLRPDEKYVFPELPKINLKDKIIVLIFIEISCT